MVQCLGLLKCCSDHYTTRTAVELGALMVDELLLEQKNGGWVPRQDGELADTPILVIATVLSIILNQGEWQCPPKSSTGTSFTCLCLLAPRKLADLLWCQFTNQLLSDSFQNAPALSPRAQLQNDHSQQNDQSKNCPPEGTLVMI